MHNGREQNRQLLVMKFGGSSVADAGAIRRVSRIVVEALKADTERTVVVVSALQGATDALRGAALAAASGERERALQVVRRLRERHYAASAGLSPAAREQVGVRVERLLDHCERAFDAVMGQGHPTAADLDSVMAHGELMSSEILAAHLRAAGLDAEAVDGADLIVTDERFQAATPKVQPTRRAVRARLGATLARGGVPVVAGYTGATAAGQRTTLGRGGSDLSATLLGACLSADEVWIWTDVDGVLSADPKSLPGAHCLPELGHEEAAQLARFGAKVLHPSALGPLRGAGVPVRVRNTFKPGHPGTLIRPRPADEGGPIQAVTCLREAALVSIAHADLYGFGIQTGELKRWAREHRALLTGANSKASERLKVILPRSELTRALDGLSAVSKRPVRLPSTLLQRRQDISLVTAVGPGLHLRRDLARDLERQLTAAGITPLLPVEPLASASISAAVPEADLLPALTAVHRLISDADGQEGHHPQHNDIKEAAP